MTAQFLSSAEPPRRETHRVGPVLFWRLALKRDRVVAPIWILTLSLTSFAAAAAGGDLYPDEASRVVAARALNATVALVALYGPILDVHSVGELSMTKLTVLYSTLVSAMALFIVRRHMRSDEDAGRAELMGAMATPVTTPLRGALLHGTGISIALGVLVAVANTAGGLPLRGSVAFGAAWTGTAMVAAGITAVACQVGSDARSAAAIASTVFACMYALRIIGDTTNASWVGWLSPYAWNTRLRSYGETRWPVLALYGVLTTSLYVVADRMRLRRDLGAGLTRLRPGPAVASPRLGGIVSLSLRTHRQMLIAWTIGIASWGLLFGLLTPSFDSFATPEVTEMLARLGGTGDFRDILITAVVSIMGILVSCFAIATVGHAGADEIAGRTEQVLATSVSRFRGFVALVIVSVGGATWLLLIVGVAQALGVGRSTSHGFVELVGSALVQAPAVWVVTSLGILLFSLRASWAPAGWAIVVAVTTLGQVGEMLNLPRPVVNISPFAHVPKMPQESFRPLPALILSALGIGIVAVAWLRYRSRDIGT